MTLSQDILAELAEITPGSPLYQARAVRDAATRHVAERVDRPRKRRVLEHAKQRPGVERGRLEQRLAVSRTELVAVIGVENVAPCKNVAHEREPVRVQARCAHRQQNENQK